MALPKRRHSKSRRNKRRTHWKLKAPTVVECSHCHQPKLPHRACPNCGYYKGRSVFIPKEV
ncbi:50S ribosomal protein L32 [candidate division KSB1 bacterium]|nr:50S ribosomal protein L32 [candidate division KSB1 bacterium]NIR71851.1 50S ribosomal protein L32 [candidate division KSB1 bacterium]NIS25367.1 50S ribosomal protein L32 [candidate division KSB1 bacterium]NIT71837.1 50S ribosomal protein L32 [candidate division KSB1 bacterium]NIU25575.1 50S ribosomal protein L32 [candidate division KSB1 bacterium]